MVHVPTATPEVTAPEATTTPVVAEPNKKAKRKAAQAAKATEAAVTPEGTTPPAVETPKAPAVPKVKGPNDLTGREALALHYIAGAPRIGAELGARMGKGISRMMGCAVKNGGVSAGLVGRGFAVVKIVEAGEGKTRHEYHITEAGRTALALAGDLSAAAAAGEVKAGEMAATKAAAKVEKVAAVAAAVTVPAEPINLTGDVATINPAAVQ